MLNLISSSRKKVLTVFMLRKDVKEAWDNVYHPALIYEIFNHFELLEIWLTLSDEHRYISILFKTLLVKCQLQYIKIKQDRMRKYTPVLERQDHDNTGIHSIGLWELHSSSCCFCWWRRFLKYGNRQKTAQELKVTCVPMCSASCLKGGYTSNMHPNM